MLTLRLHAKTLFDEEEERFIELPQMIVNMEHSLVSISKWESKHHRSLLSSDLSVEDYLSYFTCMITTQNINHKEFILHIDQEVTDEITTYMSNPMTATTFPEENSGPVSTSIRNKKITSEQIYGWMIAYGIEKVYEKWHISRLLTLIRVCEFNNRTDKKVDKKEQIRNYAELNRKRRAKLGSRG